MPTWLASTAGTSAWKPCVRRSSPWSISIIAARSRYWGGGTASSSDGQLFGVPIKTVYTQYQPQSPSQSGRAISLYTHISDHAMPFYGQMLHHLGQETVSISSALMRPRAGTGYIRFANRRRVSLVFVCGKWTALWAELSQILIRTNVP